MTMTTESLADRLPPRNIEAEQSALCSCLLSPEAIDECAEIVRAEDFYRGAHQEAFAALLDLRDAGKLTDAVGLADELIRRGRFHVLGGNEFLAELAGAVPHAANAAYYAGIVREKSISRGLIQASEETIREAYSHLHTAGELVCIAEERIFAVSERDVAGVTCSIGDSVAEGMARSAMRERGDFLGIPGGFEDLDALTGGFRAGELTVLAARPSMGKTALAMDFAVNLATAGHPVLFVSLEMGRESLGDRILSSQARLDSFKFRQPWMLNVGEKRRLADTATRLERLPVELDYTPSRNVTQIGACARRMKRRRGLALVVIDYLSLIDAPVLKGRSRQEEVAAISRGVKGIARTLGIPVLLLSQLNRQCEARDDKRPRLADLRESGQVEQDADVVLLLHRPEHYDPNNQPGIAEVDVAKNRNGPTGIVRLGFSKHCTRFDSLVPAGGLIDEEAF